MTDEKEVVPEVVPEIVEDANAALEAGFNKSRGETPDETPAESVETVEGEPEITHQEAVTLFAGKSETEIQELFDKVPGLESKLSDETRRLYGRVGNIQDRMQKIEELSNKHFAPDLDISDFDELVDEYGPELAEKLIKGLQKSFSKAPPAKAPAVVDVDARINEAVERVRDEQEKKLLTVMHKDWKTIPKEPEFSTFLNSMTGDPVSIRLENGSTIQLPSEAAKYIESDDAIVAAECFTKYKDWKATQQKASTRNKDRLEAAITPTGGNAPPPDSTIDDQTAFMRGFNKARGVGL